jgi:high-affinity iron transporter
VTALGEAFLITLREGFEASLIVAIVLAAVRAQGRPDLRRWIWLGTGAAVVLAILAGVVLHLTIEDLTGVSRQRTFAAICLAAAALLTWMIFWMRRHARSLRRELEQQVEAALGQSALALAGVAFLAVAREGLETALFLISTTSADGGGRIVLGGLLGLAIAAALGVAVYHGSRVIPMRAFFAVTGVLIILFAAGLLSRAVQFLQASGDLGTANDAAYDLTMFHWLTIDSEVGRFLAGILGWDPRPSVEQVAVYLLFAVPVLIAFFWRANRPLRPRGAADRGRPAEPARA